MCVCASAESRTQKKQIVSKRLNCFQQKKCKKVKIKWIGCLMNKGSDTHWLTMVIYDSGGFLSEQRQ